MIDPKLEITNLINPLVKIFGLIDNEWNNLMENGLREYLQSQSEKYYFTTTFIHRTEVRFHEIYYPLTASYKELTTTFKDLKTVLEDYSNITLVGSAGSGKTTLMKFIFLNAIKSSFKVPLLIELRNLNQYNGDFEKLISEKILKTNIKPSEVILKRALRDGKFIFLLDGYDEIFSSKKQDLNRQIELFIDAYPLNNCIITTRPGSGIEGFSRFKDFKVDPLTDKQVEGFIDKIVKVDERKNRILNVVKDKANTPYLEYLRNPLLLSMFIIAFENHPEIPARKSSFYRNVFDTLYSKHDGITKNSFPREKITKFDRDQFEKILNIFCYLTLINGNYSFTHELLTDVLKQVLKSTGYIAKTDDLIYDLQTTISILIQDGFEFFFPHRSMQEYFAAQFLSILPSESKAKAYRNLSEALIKSSTDYSFNLWSISLELDESSFKTFFLIPQLKKLDKKLDIINDKELLIKFFELMNTRLYYTMTSVKNKRKFMMIRLPNFSISLIRFCQISEFADFTRFPSATKINNELLKILNKRNVNMAQPKYLLEVDEEVAEILLKYGIAILIKKYKDAVKGKIAQYESENLDSKIKIDDLLNL